MSLSKKLANDARGSEKQLSSSLFVKDEAYRELGEQLVREREQFSAKLATLRHDASLFARSFVVPIDCICAFA